MPIDPEEYFLALHASMSHDASAQENILRAKGFFDQRHWHEFSVALLELTLSNNYIRSAAYDIHENVVARVRMDLSPDVYVKFVYLAAQAADANVPASSLLDTLSGAVGSLMSTSAHQHVRAVSCIRAIVLMASGDEGNVLEARRILADVNEFLRTVPAQEGNAVVQAMYHRAQVRLYELSSEHDQFYHTVFALTTYTTAASLPIQQEELAALAYKTSVAGLLGKSIYNFGQLLNYKPFCDALQAEQNRWIYDLVLSCNSGDVSATEKYLAANRAVLQQTPDLAQCEPFLLRKAQLMALLNFVFFTPAENRVFSFESIADKCRIPLDAVEPLVLHALALHLVEGSVDELEATVECTWVQPRVLSAEEIRRMIRLITDWKQAVKSTREMVEELAKDIPK